MLTEHTLLSVLLPAEHIPDGATVTKRTGEKTYVLRHRLRVFSSREAVSATEAIDVTGCFLHDGAGNINQVEPDTVLSWKIFAGALVEHLTETWEEEQSA